MSDENKLLTVGNIKNMIFSFRDLQIMINRDLVKLYGVPTKRVNEQVKKNRNRFPENIRFQLFDNEKIELVSICDRFKKLKHLNVKPYAFKEQGVAMLSAILHNQIAVEIGTKTMDALKNRFVK